MANRALAYEANQAASLANPCGNSELAAFNILCQNLSSEIQGDENAANIIGTQTGGALREGQPRTPQLDPEGDEDGDGLKNSWETDGIDVNNDGIIDFVLPNANPLHKDFYVEVDFMEFHTPLAEALNAVIASFNDAPLNNPDGIPGIILHIQVDEQIPHADTTDCFPQPPCTGLLTIKSTNFGTAAERSDPNAANLITAKEQVFHYAVFAHDQPGADAGSSGISNGIPGMEFLVTLGAPGWGDPDGDGHPSGSVDQQAGTFMHELGHNLNLHHGGNDDINCKPNYLSVMSYSRQFMGPIADRPLDYSRSDLAPLDETNLNEPDGVSASTPPGLTTVYGPTPPVHFATAGNPVDWNLDGDTNDPGVVSDINDFTGTIGGCPGFGPGIDNGFDDWNGGGFVFHTAGLGAQQSAEVEQLVEPEMKIDDVLAIRLALLDGIESAIEALVASEPGAEAGVAMSAELDTTHIAGLLEDTSQIDASIAELNELKASVTQVFGLEAAQQQVIPQIDNLIAVLESQK